MSERVEIGNLKIDAELYALVKDEIAPGTGVSAEAFWSAFDAIVQDLAPLNQALLEKRDTLKSWTIFLAIIAFALSMLGTFLVRSGVITSVHAFATDPARGLFILIFLYSFF